MFRVLSCLTQEHDLRLVAVAAVVCFFASTLVFPLMRRAGQVGGFMRRLWFALAALTIGLGAWATHFIAMLAYSEQLQVGYDETRTLASVLLVVVTSACGLAIWQEAGTPWRRCLGGAVLGLGIAAMHYLGMSGLYVPGVLQFDAVYVLASILGGAGLAMLAMALSPRAGPLATGGLLALSILVLHFTGMASVTLVPEPAVVIPTAALNRDWLALLIAISVAAALTVSLVAVLLDARAAQREVSLRLATEGKLRYLAHHDALTGLGNRILLRDYLEGTLAEASAGNESLALLYLDLDRFKLVNDLHGHATGDRLLQEVAQRLRTEVRKGDLIVRLGGDEFAVLQTGADPQSAEQTAARLVSALAKPYDLGGGLEATIAVSVGIALYPRDASDAESLLANADTALYRVKQGYRGSYAMFRGDMDRQIRDRQRMTHELREALRRQEFFLVYQPLADARSGTVIGFEALLRWQHPVRGLVMPDVFVPLAENNSMIIPIGAWVLREACSEAAKWTVPLRISVNVSAVQIHQGDLLGAVKEALDHSGLAPSRLEIEVTESMVIQDTARAIETLNQIKALGVSLAIDDFGTGYSSLSTLRAFAFDRIKVDRGFISDLPNNRDAATIIRAVLGLGHGLRLPVVAEGVETEAQLKILREEGFDEVQGFLLGHPQPIAAFAHVTTGKAAPRELLAPLAGDPAD